MDDWPNRLVISSYQRPGRESAMDELEFDEIGRWSEIKIEIMRKYAAAYSAVLSGQREPRFSYAYIDGFAGPGQHLRKGSREKTEGCAMAALDVRPPFDRYYFVDLNGAKIDYLSGLARDRDNVQYFVGDANHVLVEEVFPAERFSAYRRALCLLDPYKLQLDWRVIAAAGAERAIEIVLNFPVMDMNRSVFWKEHERVSPSNIARMNAFWGDDSWRDVAYTRHNLFREPEKTDNETVAAAFRERLVRVAGFPHVPEPLPMKNDRGAVVYYLFFASHNATAKKVMTDILKKYR